MPRTLDVSTQTMNVRYVGAERYETAVRDHTIVVDQPADLGGADTAPTPTELFVASLATCIAFYAGRYLTRHGLSREGLGVSVAYDMATDRPARVTSVHVTLRVPESVPAGRWPALRAVVGHCTVHNSITHPPSITIDLAA